MRNSEANPDAGHARERIAEILRSAMGTPEEDGLEDETRRLMLHLSIEPPTNAVPAQTRAAAQVSSRKPLLRRLLRKAAGDART
ncbi:hypothetical protein MZO42_06380 [Sphingomonas psychrotolerans]|uniref:Uncharacterized protein n=1 Tax=Sphingomonas psychrotolerans TaxID=1327635 RepID=A0ABU3N220_9SPHN|nr:hypothetical protein [Sphingomonas psychrotolerans]MDT8758316.1 hypothetical protein [Sphingomonas psychrotolerans]